MEDEVSELSANLDDWSVFYDEYYVPNLNNELEPCEAV
jgi:hypothetical protein